MVGPGGAPLDLAQALAQAQDGDVIELLPGRYKGEPMLINKRLTLRGGDAGGPRAMLVADGKDAELRAIWTVRDAEVTVENIEFSGARGRSGSAAGIRLDSGKLTLRAAPSSTTRSV